MCLLNKDGLSNFFPHTSHGSHVLSRSRLGMRTAPGGLVAVDTEGGKTVDCISADEGERLKLLGKLVI